MVTEYLSKYPVLHNEWLDWKHGRPTGQPTLSKSRLPHFGSKDFFPLLLLFGGLGYSLHTLTSSLPPSWIVVWYLPVPVYPYPPLSMTSQQQSKHQALDRGLSSGPWAVGRRQHTEGNGGQTPAPSSGCLCLVYQDSRVTISQPKLMSERANAMHLQTLLPSQLSRGVIRRVNWRIWRQLLVIVSL